MGSRNNAKGEKHNGSRTDKLSRYAEARRKNRKIACQNAGSALKAKIQQILDVEEKPRREEEGGMPR